MKTETFQRSSFLILLAVLSLTFLWMVRDFLMTVLLAAIFAHMSDWLYQFYLKHTKNRPALSSALTITTLIIVIGIPLVLFLLILGNQVVDFSTLAKGWIQNIKHNGSVGELLQRVPGYRFLAPYRETLITKAGNVASAGGEMALMYLSAFTSGTVTFFVNLLIMLYAMFFFLMNGNKILKRILYLSPLKHADEMKMLKEFQSMTRATLKGTLVIGAMQGTLAGLALALAGIPSAFFLGTVMALLSLLPAIGSGLVWVPACIFLFIKGETLKGVLVFLWCLVVVGTADNFVRPILIGKDTEMSELMVLLSTLGGLVLFGLPGFLLGPGLASLFISAWNIYGTMFKELLPDKTI